jgi:hypothetical protein
MEGIYFESTNFDLVLENLENSKSCGGRLSAPLSEQRCQTTRFTIQSEPRPLPMHAVFATVLHPWFPPPHVAIRGAPPSQFSSSRLPAPISTPLHALFYSSTQRALPPLHPDDGPSKTPEGCLGAPSPRRRAGAPSERQANSVGAPTSFLLSAPSATKALTDANSLRPSSRQGSTVATFSELLSDYGLPSLFPRR